MVSSQCKLRQSSLAHPPHRPDSGRLVIERCERLCAYCTGADAQHAWKHAWFLRRHVQAVHIDKGEKSNVILAKGWFIALSSFTCWHSY
jgi:hypothetical protein